MKLAFCCRGRKEMKIIEMVCQDCRYKCPTMGCRGKLYCSHRWEHGYFLERAIKQLRELYQNKSTYKGEQPNYRKEDNNDL